MKSGKVQRMKENNISKSLLNFSQREGKLNSFSLLRCLLKNSVANIASATFSTFSVGSESNDSDSWVNPRKLTVKLSSLHARTLCTTK